MNTKRIVTAAAAATLLLVGAAVLQAHDLFLKLDSYLVPANAPVRVAVLNGTFQESEDPVAPGRLDGLDLVAGGQRFALPRNAWSAEGDTSWLSFRTRGSGTYVIGASIQPREIHLDAADFNSYLAHDGIVDVLVQRAEDRELDRPARERYSKHVKAVFQVGEDRSGGFDVALGHRAELVPLENPYTLGAGDVLPLRVIVGGRIVDGQMVIAGGEGEDGQAFEEQSVRSDQEGVARVHLRRAGRWYVKFIHMVEADDPELEYVSRWATLTFEVR